MAAAPDKGVIDSTERIHHAAPRPAQQCQGGVTSP